MLKDSKTFLLFIFILVLLVSVTRFYQYKVNDNYVLLANVACDPEVESCFVWDCDLDEPDCDRSSYKKVEILASEAPACLEEHGCENFSCDYSSSCKVIECADVYLEEWEICIMPEPSAIPPSPDDVIAGDVEDGFGTVSDEETEI